MTYSVNTIVTAMVAVSFGSYASAMFANESEVWAKVFAALIVLIMMGVNIMGSTLVARAQSVIVFIVIGILAVFAVVTIANMDSSLLAPSGYPPLREIFSSVALTFFAFLGFGIVTFTAKDLREPSRELPRAMYLALGIATVIYVAVSLGVFGTLTVEKVIASGGTALAVAAEPSLGQAGYWLMSVTGLFATAGATNGGLYPAAGLCEQLSSSGQFPPLMGRRLGGRVPVGLLITAAGAVLLAVGFSLTAIASIGSAAALLDLYSRHGWTFPSPFRNWCSGQRPGAGRSHHRSSVPDVRLHNLDRRAGIGGDTRAYPAAQLQPGFRLETATGCGQHQAGKAVKQQGTLGISVPT